MFCFEELKYSSPCILKCNSFYFIFWGGVISFLTISIHVSWFTCCQEWGILNPSISSLELSCVMFHLKPSLRIVAIYGAHKWPKFFFYPPGEIFSRLLVHINPILFPVSGRVSSLNLRCTSIRPYQAYSFRCWFSNNSVLTFCCNRALSRSCFPAFRRHCDVALLNPSSRFVGTTFWSCLSF